MKMLLVSAGVLWDKKHEKPHPNIVGALSTALAGGNEIFLVSSHRQPKWLDDHFPFVRFQYCDFRERQSGAIVNDLLTLNAENGLKHSDVLVFGATNADLFMAANSQTLLVRCDWAALEDRIGQYGLPLREPGGIPLLLRVLKDKQPWYYHASASDLEVFALTDAGTLGEINAGVVRLNQQLRDCLKNGRINHRKEFIAHLLSSLCATDMIRSVDVWGWYPCSAAHAEHNEVMADFCKLARTTFGRKTKGPLFVRHRCATKRHLMRGPRTNAREQIETVSLNPVYKGVLAGKTVAVLDDYLAYGLSFGVAASLLRSVGVRRTIGIAMGKFGNCAQVYDLNIDSDVFGEIHRFTDNGHQAMTGEASRAAQMDFVKKFEYLI